MLKIENIQEYKNNIDLENSYLIIAKEFEVLNKFLYQSYLHSVENNLKNNSKFFLDLC